MLMHSLNVAFSPKYAFFNNFLGNRGFNPTQAIARHPAFSLTSTTVSDPTHAPHPPIQRRPRPYTTGSLYPLWYGFII